jgi:hypothetical protein
MTDKTTDPAIVSAMDIAREAHWPLHGSDPLFLDPGQVLTFRYRDGAVREFAVVRAGVAADVLLRRLA